MVDDGSEKMEAAQRAAANAGLDFDGLKFTPKPQNDEVLRMEGEVGLQSSDKLVRII